MRHALLDPPALARLGLRGGERILDYGSGLGLFARDMARAAGVPVVCVEPDPRRAEAARELARNAGETPRLDVREGNHHRLPLSPQELGTFDLVHSRFLLQELADAQEAVQALAEALRPGGRMVLLDDDRDQLSMWPPGPAVEEVWRASIRALLEAGHDPFLGRKLSSMMQLADLRPLRTETLFLGACHGQPEWDLVASWWRDTLVGSRDEILDSSAITRDLFDEVMRGFDEWCGRPDSAIWYSVCRAEATRDA
ncbi:MAG: methyltransferase domain-containing protein [Planctomycetes bacterium]|nr:methyltransferase domain-containing protein [Planctomycetota bacterium]MCB9871062.1 methyltransferase domain-containing protein [Planctomycetota bacterium]